MTSFERYSKTVAILSLLFTLIPCLVSAQKKELSEAWSYVKSGKNLDKAEKLMTNLIPRDSLTRTNINLYACLAEAVKGQYDQANEQLYLKQGKDTAGFFRLNKKLFDVYMRLDSVDARPNQKGKVSLQHHSKNAQLLARLRPNLFSAGIFHLKKQQYEQAFDYFESFLLTPLQPIFAQTTFDSTDVRMPQAAYWATYAGYRLSDAVRTLRYHRQALADTAKRELTFQYIAEARRQLNDNELYIATLKQGFEEFPKADYFFPRLFDEYIKLTDYDKALALADTALTHCDSCTLYLFARSFSLLKLERYGECIKVCDALLTHPDASSEVSFNAGTAYLAIIERLDAHRDKRQIKNLYQKARTHMERYRKAEPSQSAKWAPALYKIYLNLNLGRQFDEIDAIIKANSKN